MKLFLDDYRQPTDFAKYMHMRIGVENPIYLKDDWYIVRNYSEFCKTIDQYKGEITHISFDHDLADEHYHVNMFKDREGYMKHLETISEKTGLDCAKYMKSVYDKLSISYPRMYVHSLNPVGIENIINLFK